jgi:hypothetical protein
MRVVAALLLLLSATSASAFRGRPVNDLRFDDRAPCGIRAMATDGASALVLCSDTRDGGRLFAQLVRENGKLDPAFLVAQGSVFAAVSWNGSAYVIATGASDGLWVTTVSRGGGTTSFRKFRSDAFRAVGLASNNGRTLLVASTASETLGFILDARAEPLTQGVRLGAALEWQVAPLGDGFAFAQFGALTTITRIDANGMNLGATTIDSGALVIASSGPRLLIVHGALADLSIRTSTMHADGTVDRRAVVILTDLPRFGIVVPRNAVVWTGRDYLATIELQVELNRSRAIAFRISVNGELIGSPGEIGGHGQTPAAVAALADRALVGFTIPGTGSTFATIRHGAVTLDGPVTLLGRRVNAHDAFDVAAANGEYLAAWVEHQHNVATVRASRVDHKGAYLDGAGLVLGTTHVRNQFLSPHGLAVASNGTNWLVLWADGTVHGTRIARDGRLLDATPIDLGEGLDVDAAWGASSYAVVVASERKWSAFTLTANGAASARRTIAEGNGGDPRGSGRITYVDVRVSFDGSRFLGVANEAVTVCDPIAPACGTSRFLSAVRLDVNGVLLEPPQHRLLAVSGPIAIAGGDGRHLLVMTQYLQGSESAGVSDHYVTAMLQDGDVPPMVTPRLRLPRGHSTSVAWNGSEFVAAWVETETRRLQLARIAEAGVTAGPRTMPAEAGALAYAPRLASGAGTPSLLAYLNPNLGTEDVPRVATIFTSELESQQPVPLPPHGVTATRTGSEIRVQWTQVANAFGIDVEVALTDGGYRRIATVAGTATEAIVPAELRGDAVRLRAWNRSGASVPSVEVGVGSGRARGVRK